MWPVAVLNCATLIDSAFDVACIRAVRGGKLLANMILARLHGDRPVTLIGVAMGARLVFYCLLELYRQGARVLPPTPPPQRHVSAARSGTAVLGGRECPPLCMLPCAVGNMLP